MYYLIRKETEKCEFRFQCLRLDTYVHIQSVSGRNKCMCSSSDALCYRCVRSCAIHNSFALYGGDVIRACRAKKAECQ